MPTPPTTQRTPHNPAGTLDFGDSCIYKYKKTERSGDIMDNEKFRRAAAPMALLPLLLIPAYLVPLFILLHVTALIQARRVVLAERRQ
jgi:hypothetical protein